MLKDDFDFRFRGAGVAHADPFMNQFWMDEAQEYHRDGAPAVKYADGGEMWMQHGKPHRDGDEPAITDSQGSKGWYKDGAFHRIGKPAVMNADGTTEWWINGKQLNATQIEDHLRTLRTEEDVQRGFEVADALRHSPHPKVSAPKTASFSR